jgi:hypothetical protein
MRSQIVQQLEETNQEAFVGEGLSVRIRIHRIRIQFSKNVISFDNTTLILK